MESAQNLSELAHLSVQELQNRYAALFGATTVARNKTWLIRRIAWQMQAQAEGGLTERIRQRVKELADETHIRILAPRDARLPIPAPTSGGTTRSGDHRLPMPGSYLTRHYKDRTLRVQVLHDGFEYDGQRFKSLSAVAKAITGSHCNGFQFFGLTGGAR